MSALVDLVAKLVGGVASAFPRWRRDRRRKQRLREILAEKGFEWRTIELLAGQIAATEEETRELLVDIGARRSTGAKEVWRLPD